MAVAIWSRAAAEVGRLRLRVHKGRVRCSLSHTLSPLGTASNSLTFSHLLSPSLTFSHLLSYLTSPWNRLDFIIVIVSFLTLLSDVYPMLTPLSNFRILRVLRPLRLVSRITAHGLELL